MPRRRHLDRRSSSRHDRAVSHDEFSLPGPDPERRSGERLDHGRQRVGSRASASNISASSRSKPSATMAPGAGPRLDLNFLSRPRPEDVTFFTGDLALLLQDRRPHQRCARTCYRTTPTSAGCGRPSPRSPRPFSAARVSPMRWRTILLYFRRCMSRSCGLARPPAISSLSSRRSVPSGSAPRRCAGASATPCAIPPSCLVAASAVLVFFLTFVLPQFGAVLRDFNAKLDPIVLGFLSLSDFLRAHTAALAARSSSLSAAAGFCCAVPACAARSWRRSGICL